MAPRALIKRIALWYHVAHSVVIRGMGLGECKPGSYGRALANQVTVFRVEFD